MIARDTGIEDALDELLAAIRAHAVARPAATAISDAGTDVSYAELLAQIGFWKARHTAEPWYAPGCGVAFSARSGLAVIAAMLGAWEAGCYIVLTNPDGSEEELLHEAGVSGASAVCLPAADGTPCGALRPVGAGTTRRSWPGLAYVACTTGSTGQRKHVAVSRAAIGTRIRQLARTYRLSPADTALQFASPEFDVFFEEVLPTLSAGARIWIPADRSVGTIAHDMGSAEVTVANLPSGFMGPLLRHLPADVAAVRLMIIGSEPVDPAAVSAWLSRYGHVPLLNAYGAAETAITASVGTVREAANIQAGLPLSPGSIVIADPGLAELPAGQVGEILVGGAGLADGYPGSSGRTADRFRPDHRPGRPGQRLFRTGDYGWLDDAGCLHVTGRIDTQPKVGGRWFPSERLAAAACEHPWVQLARCVTVPGGQARKPNLEIEVAGSDMSLLTACTERWLGTGPADAAEAGIDGLVSAVVTEEIARFLAARLPASDLPSRLLPRGIEPYVAALARLSRAQTAGSSTPARPPEPAAQPGGPGPGAAQDASVVSELRAVFAAALDRPAVGSDDNFFDLGGDSITAVQAIALAAKAGLHISVRDLFTHQTARALASRATAVSTAVAPARRARHGDAGQNVPLSPAACWFLSYATGDLDSYSQAGCFLIEGTPAAGALRAVNACLARHPLLASRLDRSRSVFDLSARLGMRATLVDLSGLPPQQARELRAEFVLGAQRAVKMDSGPLSCWLVFRTAADSVLVVGVVHHLVCDSVSWSVLERDMRVLAAGEPGKLEPEDQIRAESLAWHQAMREAAHGPRARELAAGWAAVSWPGRLRPAAAEAHRPLERRIVITGGDARRIVQRAQELGHDVEHLILGAVAAGCLGGLNEDAIVVDCESHGRDGAGHDSDLSNLVGWFTAVWPVPIRRAAGISDQVAAVKAAVERFLAIGWSYGPLKYLSSEPGIRRAMGQIPAADVSFNFAAALPPAPGLRAVSQAVVVFPGDTSRMATFGYLLDVNAAQSPGRLVIDLSSAVLPPQAFAAITDGVTGQLVAFAQETGIGGIQPLVTPDTAQPAAGDATTPAARNPDGVDTLFSYPDWRPALLASRRPRPRQAIVLTSPPGASDPDWLTALAAVCPSLTAVAGLEELRQELLGRDRRDCWVIDARGLSADPPATYPGIVSSGYDRGAGLATQVLATVSPGPALFTLAARVRAGGPAPGPAEGRLTAMLAAAATGLRREFPGTEVTCVLATGSLSADLWRAALAAENGATLRDADGHGVAELTYRQEVPPASGGRPQPGEGYIVTGASGGLGGLLVRWLTEDLGAAVACVSRHPHSALPPGAVPIQADLSDPADVAAMLATARSVLPGVAGVFHLAGVAAGRHTGVQRREDASRVFGAKALGAQHLVDALAGQPDRPGFLLLASSLTAVDALVGETAYAAANAYLNGLAEDASRAGRWVTAIAWDAIADVGMAAGKTDGLTPAQVRRVITAALASDEPVHILHRTPLWPLLAATGDQHAAHSHPGA